MADFTALHQALGLPPGPISDEMLTEAVAQGVEESDQLDWKRALTAENALATRTSRKTWPPSRTAAAG